MNQKILRKAKIQFSYLVLLLLTVVSFSLAGMSVVYAAAPSAPRNVQVQLGDTLARVRWDVPLEHGAGNLRYTVVAVPVDTNLQTKSATTPYNIAYVYGLTNGKAYNITVYATDNYGNGVKGPEVTVSKDELGNDIKPYLEGNSNVTLPQTPIYDPITNPTSNRIELGDRLLIVRFTLDPEKRGFSPVEFTLTATPVNPKAGVTTVTKISTWSEIVITGLVNNEAYTLTVSVKNNKGTCVTPLSIPGTYIPEAKYAVQAPAPTYKNITAGDRSAIIEFSMDPLKTGYSWVSNYVATAYLEDGTKTDKYGERNMSPVTVTGLDNGTKYKFKIVAYNSAGAGKEPDDFTSIVIPLAITKYTVEAASQNATPTAGSDNTITLTVKDSEGKVDTSFSGDHSVSVSSTTLSDLYGFIDATQLNGVAQTVMVNFTNGIGTVNLKLNKAVAQTINFSIPEVNKAAANPITITPSPGAPDHLKETQPVEVSNVNGAVFTQQPKVSVYDIYDNLCTNNSELQVTVDRSTTAWVLTGVNKTVKVVNGVASFSGLGASSTTGVQGAKLVYSSNPALASITGQEFSISAPSSNANLSNLIISKGTLSPTFAAGTTVYTASVANAVNSITVTPTLADTTAGIKVNNVTVANGTASGSIPLSVGNNTITVEVTAQNGTTSKTYTITVTRAPSANANLSSLIISNSTLSPTFAAATTAYTASVANEVSSITVTPILADTTASIKVNNVAAANGTASGGISLNVGANTITVEVTAQDGTTSKTYTITVTRALSANANLSNLTISNGTLSPMFAAGTTGYTASVTNDVSSITVTPTLADITASIKVNNVTAANGTASGSISLNVGANTITVEVTAQDGTTSKAYTITVTRAPSSNANLSNLTISNGTLSPMFAAGTTGYTASVTNAISSITVTPNAEDSNATISVNASEVANGGSHSINLNAGDNTITVSVTAQDTTTTKIYIITVNRAKSSNANLSSLGITGFTTTESFVPNKSTYNAIVPYKVSSISISPIAQDNTSAITVNGIPITADEPTATVTLVEETINIINISVMAQDGISNQIYRLNITREGVEPGTVLKFRVYSDEACTNEITDKRTRISKDSYVYVVPYASGIYDADGSNGKCDTFSIQLNFDPTKFLFDKNSGWALEDPLGENMMFLTNILRSKEYDTSSIIVYDIDGVGYKYLCIPIGTLVPVNECGLAVFKLMALQDTTCSFTSEADYDVGMVKAGNILRDFETVTDFVAPPPSTVADLASLSISNGTLSSSFASENTNYSANVINSVSSITITPVAADTPYATVRVNGVQITNEAPTATIALNVGDNPVEIVVTAEDGNTNKTYTLNINRSSSIEVTIIALMQGTTKTTPDTYEGATIRVFDGNATDYTTPIETVQVSSGKATFIKLDMGTNYKFVIKAEKTLTRAVTGSLSALSKKIDYTVDGTQRLLKGDLNNDDQVSTSDASTFRVAFQKTAVGDLNGDNMTSSSDASLFRTNFQKKGVTKP